MSVEQPRNLAKSVRGYFVTKLASPRLAQWASRRSPTGTAARGRWRRADVRPRRPKEQTSARTTSPDYRRLGHDHRSAKLEPQTVVETASELRHAIHPPGSPWPPRSIERNVLITMPESSYLYGKIICHPGNAGLERASIKGMASLATTASAEARYAIERNPQAGI
jgi:hypothetical protein